jgi:DNA-binding GntR family transcriptional regulator
MGGERVQPLYKQVREKLREGIIAGQYLGTLPPESSLVLDFRVSRGTLRQALGLLTEEGLIEPRQGLGTLIRWTPESNESQITTTPPEAPSFRRTLQRITNTLLDPELNTHVKLRLIGLINNQIDLIEEVRQGNNS